MVEVRRTCNECVFKGEWLFDLPFSINERSAA